MYRTADSALLSTLAAHFSGVSSLFTAARWRIRHRSPYPWREVVPVDGTGNYESDGFLTLDDFYFFHECLSNRRPGINGGPGQDSGPGCRFADFNADASTDLSDFATFQLRFDVT